MSDLLEWMKLDSDPNRYDEWEATTPLGKYTILARDGSDSPWWSVGFNNMMIADKEGPEEAKAAAQFDYDVRVSRND